MKKKSSKYDTPDAGGWMHAADDLFLAQFRGQPCRICDALGQYSGHDKDGDPIWKRSCGHHGIEKDMCRTHRYNKEIIVQLCPHHHDRKDRAISPHSIDPVYQGAWWEWLRNDNPEQYNYIMSHAKDKFEKDWFYREMYEKLGGEIKKVDKDGKKLAMKYWKPVNHLKNVILTIHRCGGVLTKDEAEKLEKWND